MVPQRLRTPDGSDTPGVFRHGRWFLRNSNTTGDGEIMFSFGLAGDLPVVGDWDGNGSDEAGVLRQGKLLARLTTTTGSAEYVAPCFELAAEPR